MVDIARDEGFHSLERGSLERGDLGELDDPLAAQILRAVLGPEIGDLVREPIVPSQDAQAGRLADALRPLEDDDVVDLAARAVDPGDRGDQPLGPDAAQVGRVLLRRRRLLTVQVVVREAGIERLRIDPGAEIGLEPHVEARRAVPAQALEIPAHGVVPVV